MDKDSIPTQNEGDQLDHSLQQDVADTTDNSQSSNEEDNQFWEDNSQEEEETTDGAPSQTPQTDDDTTEVDDNTEETQDNSQDDNTVDPELEKWANSQNISLETDTEIKLAKRLRDTQKGFHEAKAESKQKFVEATNDPADPVAQRLEAKLARIDFFEAHTDARELEGEMYDIAIEAKESGDLAGFNYYQTPKGWETLYKIAKANKAEVQSDDSYTAGRTDERKNLAKKQQASSTRANATNTAPDSGNIYDKVEKMNQAEYNEFIRKNPDFNPFGG